MSYGEFPCSGCGACCKIINIAIKNTGQDCSDKSNDFHFPYKWDNSGRCEMLDDENKCF